jgi:hypothetical protein
MAAFVVARLRCIQIRGSRRLVVARKDRLATATHAADRLQDPVRRSNAWHGEPKSLLISIN